MPHCRSCDRDLPADAFDPRQQRCRECDKRRRSESRRGTLRAAELRDGTHNHRDNNVRAPGRCPGCDARNGSVLPTIDPGSIGALPRGPNLAAFDLEEQVVSGGPQLAAFGSPIERLSAEAMIRLGSVDAAAVECGLTPEVLRGHLSELVRRAATRGWTPGADVAAPTPTGFHVKGVSTFYGRDGEVRGQWVKTKRDEEHRFAALLDAVKVGLGDLPRTPPTAPPAADVLDDNLLSVIPLGDPHFGMFSWALETGQDFDLAIAESNLVGAVEHLVALAPRSRRGLLIDLGDYFHGDNSSNMTARSHNALDIDTRWSKVIHVGVRAMRRAISLMLLKHEQVDVIIRPGNHDDHSAVLLQVALAQFYEHEPRVWIDPSPAMFTYYRFGKNLFGITHGHTVKVADLAEIMACDRPTDWGETSFRKWFVGHFHHEVVKERRGVTTEIYRTLAPADAWHKGQGYRSGQDLRLEVYDKELGPVLRHTVGIQHLLGKKVIK